MNDRLARMRWLIDDSEKAACEVYWHTPFTVTDETLRNFYSSFSCDFKIYLPDKPGIYGLLFQCLEDAEDRYISTVIPYECPTKRQ